MAPNTAGDPIEPKPFIYRDADGNVTTPPDQDDPAVKPPGQEFPEERPGDAPGLPETGEPG